MKKINRLSIKVLFSLAIVISMQCAYPKQSYAIYDPLSQPNNMFGIHILFPEEIDDAAKLVNSKSGDWGYVTIPIQAGDKNIQKWQKFMNRAKQLHLIPIIRIATEEDFTTKGVWRMPNDYDVVDFANFLSSLSWPTKNRYVVLFNEVNRFDEWGGKSPDPSYYADLVDFSYTTFKNRSEDFYILLSAFDNAAVTDGVKYVNEFDYLMSMKSYNKNIFEKIDGIASHSYPNPGFLQPPSGTRKMGTATYKYEYNMINSFTDTKKPVFITETGWDNRSLSDSQISSYFKNAFENIWTQDREKIVAVTPFVLKSTNGLFDMFSFLDHDNPTPYFKTLQDIDKVKGIPVLSDVNETPKKSVLSVSTVKNAHRESHHSSSPAIQPHFPILLKWYFKAILGLLS